METMHITGWDALIFLLGAGTLGYILKEVFNGLWRRIQRDPSAVASIERARIDDGAGIRSELWKRINTLELTVKDLVIKRDSLQREYNDLFKKYVDLKASYDILLIKAMKLEQRLTKTAARMNGLDKKCPKKRKGR